MSTYVYMRILESAPYRYDLGLRMLSLGRIEAIYEETAHAAVDWCKDARVLEIGCGTGNLTRAMLSRGARVTAIDSNPDMLEIAGRKLSSFGDRVDLREMAAVEIADRFAPASFDTVAASLVLSEMSEQEQAYVLSAVRRVLRPGGRIVIADEVRPSGSLARIGYAVARAPLAALTWLLTQTTTSAVERLAAKLEAAGLPVLERRRRHAVEIVVAERPLGED